MNKYSQKTVSKAYAKIKYYYFPIHEEIEKYAAKQAIHQTKIILSYINKHYGKLKKVNLINNLLDLLPDHERRNWNDLQRSPRKLRDELYPRIPERPNIYKLQRDEYKANLRRRFRNRYKTGAVQGW